MKSKDFGSSLHTLYQFVRIKKIIILNGGEKSKEEEKNREDKSRKVNSRFIVWNGKKVNETLNHEHLKIQMKYYFTNEGSILYALWKERYAF